MTPAATTTTAAATATTASTTASTSTSTAGDTSTSTTSTTSTSGDTSTPTPSRGQDVSTNLAPANRATANRATANRATMRGFEQSLPMKLMRAREAVMRHFRPILTDHDVSEQQWRVLRALNDTDVPMSVGELADRTFLLGPSLSRMLAALDDRALIVRSAGDDARRSEVRISGTGAALVAQIAPLSEAAYDHIEHGLEPGELDQLSDLLTRLAAEPDPTTTAPTTGRQGAPT